MLSLNNKYLKNYLLGLLVLFVLSCQSDSEGTSSDITLNATISLSIDLGNFFLGGTGSDSPWIHNLQPEVSITFSSTSTDYSKSIPFNPNDPNSFPEVHLPIDSYNWSIPNEGMEIAVSDVLLVYAASSSPLEVSAGANEFQIPLQTDFALVTVASDNVVKATLEQELNTYDLYLRDGYYYGYINTAKSNFKLDIETTDGLFAQDRITTPEAYKHYNYNLVYQETGILGVDIQLADDFILTQGNVVLNADLDLDGVIDLEDLCPDTPPGAPVDENGCSPNPIYLDENGITVKAFEWAITGMTGELNGKVYSIVDKPTLLQMVVNQEDVSTVCTSKITDLSELFSGSTYSPDISSWDVSNVTNMFALFYSSQFNGDISHWDVSSVTNMRSIFNTSIFNGDISGWDVSKVLNMRRMFWSSQFNGDISRWDVSNVTEMEYLFRASIFNQDISSWDVSSVTNMNGMFWSSQFNGDISRWDVSNVNDMSMMFSSSQFNGDVSNWDVSNVTNMKALFNSSPFNGDISNWNVSSVTDMSSMFGASQFNGDISKWDVSNALSMKDMFSFSQFNGDISGWDVSNVQSMARMFRASQFNRDISNWNVSNVNNMWEMFSLSVFNGDIGAWNVTSVIIMQGMFSGANSFNQDISNWDVSGVINMANMFDSSILESSFNQDLSNWNVENVSFCQNFSLNSVSWTLPKPNFTNCTP